MARSGSLPRDFFERMGTLLEEGRWEEEKQEEEEREEEGEERVRPRLSSSPVPWGRAGLTRRRRGELQQGGGKLHK